MPTPATRSLLLLGVAILGGCTSGKAPSGGEGAGIVVSLVPQTARVASGGSVSFLATVAGTTDTGVLWSVSEGAAGGSVSASGLYTAPGVDGVYHVVAASRVDSSRQQVAVVTVATPGAPAGVVLSPGSATLAPGQSITFTATVSGSANQGVTWSVREGPGCGTVGSSGVYNAPSVASTCHVVATSVVDAAKSGSATITITSPPLPDGTTVCDRVVPESVSSSIACTPLPLGPTYDGCSGSNLACGPVHGCVLERNESVAETIVTSRTGPEAGFQPPARLLPSMGASVTGRGSAWFTRGDGTLAKGSCSFPAVKNIMVAALTSQQFGNADWCGACAEVVGRSGSRVRIEIVDQCAGCAPGGLDLAAGTDSPYVMLNVPGNPDTCRDGLLPITWKIVPCETNGGIVVHYMEGYNVYTPAVQIRNHRLPLVKLEEYQLGQWVDVPRRADNKYVLPDRTSSATIGLPITIRVTAEDGSTITGTFPPFVAGMNHEGTDQF